MKLQQIKVAEAYESATNPRGKDFEGQAFSDLLASVKEKGVLVPVIARPREKGGKLFEIIAGNRRFRAAKQAGLDEIPARIEDYDDNETREVQIIENLQREDVHPIEEGNSYRQLVEKAKYDIASIAVRVGKSETYVRQRLFLTNLTEKLATAYRKGKFTDAHAVLIAKLSPNDQPATLKYINGCWSLPSVKDLQEWVATEFYKPLSFQPWLKSVELNEVVGACKECEPNRNSLFGEVKEGACTDIKCWNRKMTRYVDHLASSAEVPLLKVTKEYGKASNGVLSQGEYELLSAKKKCAHAQHAIVAKGADRGTMLWVCASVDCKTHGKSHTPYRMTPEERERRKQERAEEKAKQEQEAKAFLATLETVKWPMTAKTLDALFEAHLGRHNGAESLRPICRRYGWEPIKVNRKGWDGKMRNETDWEKTVRAQISTMNDQQRLQFFVGFMLETSYESSREKAIKLLNTK